MLRGRSIAVDHDGVELRAEELAVARKAAAELLAQAEASLVGDEEELAQAQAALEKLEAALG